MKKLLRTVYLDQDIDEALGRRAADEGTTKADLMRSYIAQGLERGSTAFARAATETGNATAAHVSGPAGTKNARSRPAEVAKPKATKPKMRVVSARTADI